MSGPKLGLAALILLAAGLGLLRSGLVTSGPTRESWSLLALSSGPGVLSVSTTVSDAGFLADMMTTRLAWLGAKGPLLEHRAEWGPTTLTDDGVSAGPDRLVREGEGWILDIGGEELSARIRIATQPGCPPPVGEVIGQVRAEPTGQSVAGRGLLLRHRVQGHPEGVAIYVIDRTFSLGIDPWSDCPGWWVDGAASWTGTPPTVPLQARWTGRLGEREIEVRAIGRRLVVDEHEHLMIGERLLAEIAGFPAPTVTFQRVRVWLPQAPDRGPLVGVRVVRGVRSWR